jgi:hypothetical protein
MREIKFRAWDGEKMIFPSDPDTYSKFVRGELVCPGVILMQYTGLEDKNGKEIYEGDIVRGIKGDIYQVFFGNGAFRTGSAVHAKVLASGDEIICNLYVDLELSKGERNRNE